MSEKKLFFLNLFVFCIAICTCRDAFSDVPKNSQAGLKVFVGSLGQTTDAVYLRDKLIVRLEKSNTVLVVDDPRTADLLVVGSAAMRIVGYYNSNPRIRYRNATSVPVYDAKMSLVLKDTQGRVLWSGILKPRFWGSQYVSDNIVNQAAHHVVEELEVEKELRHSHRHS